MSRFEIVVRMPVSNFSQAYQTPVYFRSDWLNEYWESFDPITDDYRFVYIGPKGSWTPFHSDVYGSFSWSANVVGKKHWIFIPPGGEECLKDVNGKLVYDLRKIDSLGMELKKYPFISFPFGTEVSRKK